jgi:hypothetical protein
MRRLLMLTSLVACGGIPKGGEMLTESIRGYNEDLRWERFESASSFLPRTQRATRVDEWDDRAHELKITGFDVVKVDRRGEREARVQVKLEWYRSSDNTVHETHAVQTWERQGRAWVVVDEARLRGPEMPGLPEPLEHDPGHAPPRAR